MTEPRQTHKLPVLRVRDPFILADPDTQTFYLCVALRPSEGHPRPGVGVYTSKLPSPGRSDTCRPSFT